MVRKNMSYRRVLTSDDSSVYRSPSDAGKTFDYIICAHKAINPGSAPPLFNDVTDENTTFVLIQNGVGNEDPFREAFPNCSIISCVTWTGATQHNPGIISHGDCEDMQIGLYPNHNIQADLDKAHLDRFAELLEKGGTVFQVEEDIQIKRWEKVH
jgi:ketopantoate reductase